MKPTCTCLPTRTARLYPANFSYADPEDITCPRSHRYVRRGLVHARPGREGEGLGSETPEARSQATPGSRVAVHGVGGPSASQAPINSMRSSSTPDPRTDEIHHDLHRLDLDPSLRPSGVLSRVCLVQIQAGQNMPYIMPTIIRLPRRNMSYIMQIRNLVRPEIFRSPSENRSCRSSALPVCQTA